MVPNILEQPAEQLQVVIRKSFKEDPKTRDAHLEAIKEWLRQEPHLPNEWDEKRIMTFLRGCNFSLEKTKRKLDMYFTMRTLCPEFFSNRNPEDPALRQITQLGCAPALPQLTPEGNRLTCIYIPEAQEINVVPKLENVFKLGLMMGDIRLLIEETGVYGDIFVVDCSVATWTNLKQVSPTLMKKFLIVVQEAYPVKVKAVHLVNASPVTNTILTIVKHVVKEKIRNRIHIHPDFESLHKAIPKELLPAEFGGTNKTIEYYHNMWVDYLGNFAQWFVEQENVKADESKRIGKPTNYDDLFGVEGSFKKLNID